MATITIDTSSISNIITKLERVEAITPSGSKSIVSALKKPLDRIGNGVLKYLIKETPVGDNTRPDYDKSRKHLRDSWRWKLEARGSVIEGNIYLEDEKLNDLVDLLEAGSPRHVIKAKPGNTLSFYVRRGGGWKKIYTPKVNHPGFKANKFTERAQDRANTLITELTSIVQSKINRIILGK